MRTFSILLLAVLATAAVVLGQTEQVSALAAAKKAVEARLSPPQNTSTVRLINVTTSTVPNRGAVLALTMQLPSTDKFEFHAETTYILIWQALAKVPNVYKHLSRVQLTLRHAPRTMMIDCPAESVEDMYGFTDFARLKRLCAVR